MVIQINRQECLDKYSNFPKSDNLKEDYFYPKYYSSFILKLETKSKNENSNNLSNEFTKLLIDFGIDSLIFLGDTNMPWLYLTSSNEHVKKALHYFKDNKISKTFNGALEVKIDEMVEFIMHLYLLTSIFAALPIFHFMDKKQNFVGNVCQYGHVHMALLNKKADQRFRKLIEKSDFNYLLDKQC